MFPGLTLLFNHYTPYSYSYIIDLSDEYEFKKEDFLDNIKFIKTPYIYGNDYDFVSSIIVNNWTFMEIYNEKSIDTDIPRWYYEAELRKSISVTSVKDTEFIEIKVTNTDPMLASQIANEIANVFTVNVAEIYSINNVHLVDQAEPANAPSNINHLKDFVSRARENKMLREQGDAYEKKMKAEYTSLS